MYKNILLPTDHSELADKANDQGLTLARMLGAKVTILTIFEPLRGIVAEGVVIPIPEEARQAVVKKIEFDLKKVAARAAAQKVPCDTAQVEADQPWRAIVDEAQKRACDLIIMASHGRRGVSALILGSETQKVLTHSKIPVLVYR
ncbi:MAG: universal stress protein [Hyphomicrobiaceae bacterium]|nr:universal stress protein [Hyphomicrobiaceae bacterium]